MGDHALDLAALLDRARERIAGSGMPNADRIVVEPDVRNTAVHAKNAEVGFERVADVQLPDKRAAFSVCTRDAFTRACSPTNRAWDEAERLVTAKAIGEFAHELLITPEPLESGAYALRIPAGDDRQAVDWYFRARRYALEHWHVDPRSIERRTLDGRIGPASATTLVLDLRDALSLDGDLLTTYLEELSSTVAHRVRTIDPSRPTSADLLDAPAHDVEAAMAEGHPCFVATNGRIGFSAADLAAYSPEAGADEIVMPESWVEDLGAGDAEDLIGTELTVVAATPLQEHKSVTATVVGVTKAAASGAGTAPTPSESLEQAIYDITTEGLPESQRDTYFQATAIVEDPEANEDAVKQALADQGLLAQTLEEQLGVIRGIIDAVTWVLTGFALIALLAASFGIINTLLMAVQERTREIGLMKALGMTGGKIFGLFTMEAVVIGLLGSLIGIGLGVAVGLIANQVLTTGPLSGVTGLVLFAVNPLALLLILLLIVAIAFIAGTLPALRAARKDPIEALRHE